MVLPDSSFHCQMRSMKEFLPAEVAAVRLLALHQLALDHHLRGDAGMVGAGLPQHVAPAHALETDEDVLKRIVEGVPHMERAGDVRRRNDNCVRLAGRRAVVPRGAGGKGSSLFPSAIDGVFDRLRLIGLVEHGRVGFRRERDARASYAVGFFAVNLR